MLVAFIAVEAAQFWLRVDASAPFSGPGEGTWGIAANLLLVQSMHTLPAVSFNWPSWSISVEFWTYLLFAGILAAFPKRWPVIIAILASACLIALTQLRGNLYAMGDFGLLRCIYGFACGIGANAAYQRVREMKLPHASLIEWSALAIVASYISYGAYGRGSFAAPLIFTPFVVLFALERGNASTFLSRPAFIAIGTLSYSIYMVHIFIAGKLVLMPASILQHRFGLTLLGTVNGQTALGTNMLTGTLLELAYLAVVMAASAATYRLIESPCREWGRRIYFRPDMKLGAAAVPR